MPGREPTPEDGPLFRSAHRRADAIDRAQAGGERRRAWARFVPSALVAVAEGFLRETMIMGAVLFSVIAAVIGATSGDAPWAVGCVAAGVVGCVLVLVAVARHWSFGRQWAVILGVFALQCALMVAFWTTR
ncbi:MAG: hypothetical protein GEV28_35935 [Actinophytocola sp.]|uniref:hypothetical protein n=1 Tax=Actinophytocola sp. TaxID=1872138 RepID=UPI00132A4D5A|nr:hypothetical protein [Actinophytocola sp.]MPZ85486.1 hypothetical protein [Actinophytocola sp.]